MANDAHGSDEVFDVKRVREFIELMREFDLNEIDLKHSPRRIRLRRGAETVVATAPAPSLPVAATPAAATASAAAPAAPRADEENVQVIKSPMVGTFYGRPKPDKPAFVNVGDSVSADTIVCIVEAMKMFNEIPAGVAGKIVQVCVKDGEPVDVNKPLFKVSP